MPCNVDVRWFFIRDNPLNLRHQRSINLKLGMNSVAFPKNQLMRISIPKPCHEDWNQMSPDDKGRFCLSCQKTVVDFTKMDKSEIQQYFQTALNEKVCGRIKATDLAQEIILPEVHVYPTRFFVAPNYTPSRLFLMTVGLIFLYSCNHSDGNFTPEHTEPIHESDVRDIDSNDILIGDTVVLPEKKSENYPFVLGEIIEDSPRSIDNRNNEREPTYPPPPPDFDTNPSPVLIKEEFVLGNVHEIYPEFPGGEQAMFDFLLKNVNYNFHTMITGKVYVRFTIEKDGAVSNPTIVRGVSPDNDAEVLRVISMMPKWIPGSYQGKPTSTSVVIPVVFG
jgi:hypothetical protein